MTLSCALVQLGHEARRPNRLGLRRGRVVGIARAFGSPPGPASWCSGAQG